MTIRVVFDIIIAYDAQKAVSYVSLNNLIDLNYSFYILACAVFFPIAAAIAVFICLRRAGTVRKILGYFIPMPLYVALCIFGEPWAISVLRGRFGIAVQLPDVIGFLATLTVGILYLGIVSLICGKGIKKRGGRITCGIFTVICAALCGYLTVMQNVCFPSDVVTIPEAADRMPVVTLGELFGHFGIIFDCNIGLDLIALAVLAVYLIVYFLTFIGACRSAEEELVSAYVARKKSGGYDPAVEPCCAVCEHARLLRDSPDCVLCDRTGVVSEDHSCRRFVYDPLKRRPARIPLPGSADGETK